MYGEGSKPYLTKPVRVWDGDVVGAVTPLSAAAVGDGGQVGEVSVQVDVLSVVPANVGRVISGTLWNAYVLQEIRRRVLFINVWNV